MFNLNDNEMSRIDEDHYEHYQPWKRELHFNEIDHFELPLNDNIE